MTVTEAKDYLVSQSIFFDHWAKDLYIPRASEHILGAIEGAYKIINPQFSNAGCSDCKSILIAEANRARLSRIKELETKEQPVKYTFPKQ